MTMGKARPGLYLWTMAGVIAGLFTIVPPFSVAAWAQDGRIEGTVLLSPRIASRRPRFRLYSEYGQSTSPPDAGERNEMANVVIYIDSVLSGGPLPPPAAGTFIMRQVKEAFAPHVLPVVAGSTVQFPNDDAFFHNVFSLSRTRTFDLGRFPQGASKSVRFDQPGVVQVFCHIHSDMSAVVVVLENAFHATPNAKGSFALTGVPTGTYRVTAWHERTKPISLDVRVEPGKTARTDFNIPINEPDPVRR